MPITVTLLVLGENINVLVGLVELALSQIKGLTQVKLPVKLITPLLRTHNGPSDFLLYRLPSMCNVVAGGMYIVAPLLIQIPSCPAINV